LRSPDPLDGRPSQHLVARLAAPPTEESVPVRQSRWNWPCPTLLAPAAHDGCPSGAVCLPLRLVSVRIHGMVTVSLSLQTSVPTSPTPSGRPV